MGVNMDLFDLTGKVALVTGSTKGLGETSAKALAKAGADVAVCGRNPTDLKRVSTEIQAMGRKSTGFELDVLSKEKVKKGIEEVLSHFGHIDILVNNAGTNYRVPVLEYPEEMWDLIINTNLKGYFLVAQAVVPPRVVLNK
jgi:NAD(P)-dependent dehydrogenase (short-subunit alcohol dehydrogenase family)